MIYDAAFRADMAGRPDFRGWVVDHYVATYPNPPRRKRYEQGEELAGFEHVATRQYEHRLAMTRDRLATYLLSQSNLNVVIAGGTKSEAELRAWLHEQLTQFFGNVATGSFLFGGTISCLRRDS